MIYFIARLSFILNIDIIYYFLFRNVSIYYNFYA